MKRLLPGTRAVLWIAIFSAALAMTSHAQDRATMAPKPTWLPNPYRLVPDWPTLPTSMKGPNGRRWGEVIRVHVAPDGNIWVFHRCFNDQPNGDATCVNRGEANPPILQFDLGKMTDTGTSASGIAVDAAGTIYAADVGFNNLRKYVRVQ